MTNDKAREYFSAYSEGTLDAGLAQSFEAKLNADGGLRAEYNQFESTLKELELLRYEKIEIPFDLNDRIGAAIDRNIYEKKRTAQPGWTLWLRNLSFGALAAAAIFGAYVGINARMSGPTMTAGIGGNTPRPATIEQIEYSKSASGVRMHYQPSDPHMVTIRGGSEGAQKFEAGKNGWLNDLNNSQPGAATFVVEVANELPATTVVVPGVERRDSDVGDGSLVEFAKAVADEFGVPVILRSAKAEVELSWDLSQPDALRAVQAALKSGFAVDERGGIVYIGDV